MTTTERTTDHPYAAEPGTHERIVPASVRRTAATVAATLGAAAAITALAAPASATGRYHVWDRVADCESSGDWHINTGNGFYGGLQFTDDTWDAYGGEKYAGRADHASRLEQIEVARRVLDAQGPGAWPVCSGKAGLTRGNGHATSSALPDDPDGESTTAPSAKVRTAQVKAAKAEKAEKAEKRATAEEAEKAKKARKRAEAERIQQAGKPTTPSPTPRPKPYRPKHAAAGTHTVRAGETLAAIARELHLDGWQRLYDANDTTVDDPGVIRVGQVLQLPS